ncbi:hypothetical protein O6V14_00830 [Sphingomonas faeni]|uniref:hypothetical protein n=1 Tax=Sphingomonas faeni TaxID=185950 RepID=UPI0033497ACE
MIAIRMPSSYAVPFPMARAHRSSSANAKRHFTTYPMTTIDPPVAKHAEINPIQRNEPLPLAATIAAAGALSGYAYGPYLLQKP